MNYRPASINRDSMEAKCCTPKHYGLPAWIDKDELCSYTRVCPYSYIRVPRGPLSYRHKGATAVPEWQQATAAPPRSRRGTPQTVSAPASVNKPGAAIEPPLPRHPSLIFSWFHRALAIRRPTTSEILHPVTKSHAQPSESVAAPGTLSTPRLPSPRLHLPTLSAPRHRLTGSSTTKPTGIRTVDDRAAIPA